MAHLIMTRSGFLAFCLCAFLSLPAAAQAPISDAGQQALKTQIQTFIDKQKNARQLSGGRLTTDGDILIEQADTYYAVTLPAITVTDESGQTADIGIIAINAVPEATPGNWKLSISLPTPISWKNAAGTPIRKLDIGNQRLSGVWNDTLSGFTTLDGTYDNVRISDMLRQKTYTIAKAVIANNLKETKPGIWSGTMGATLTGMAGAGAAGTGSSKADTISLSMDVRDLSAAKQQQMREKIGAFAENTNPRDLETMSPAGQLALYNMIVDMMRSAGSGVSLKMGVTNFAADIPAMAGRPARKATMKNGSLGLDLSGLDTGNVTLGIKSVIDSLLSPTVSTADAGLIPSDLNLDMKVNNLPFEELVKIGQDSIKTAGKGGAAKQFAGIQAMISLPQVLSQAGANVVITDTTFSNATYDGKIGGTMKADTTSGAGAVGRMKAEVSGLDAVIANLQTRMNASTDAAQKARLQKTIQNLTVFNLAGQAEKRGSKTVKIYDFELTQKGQMLLNGADLSLLTGLAGATANKPKAR